MAETGGCASPISAYTTEKNKATPQNENFEEVQMVQAQVGKEAPDFEVKAYYKGEFTNVKLSDFRGKWTLLCFYPGDFTYV